MMHSNFDIHLLFIFKLIILTHVYCEDFPTKTFVSDGIIFHLRQSNRNVYKNVPIWFGDASGLKYKGNPTRSEEICEDLDRGAAFLPNINCPYNGQCDGVCFFGIYGTTEKQTFFNLYKYTINGREQRNLFGINNSQPVESQIEFYDYYDYVDPAKLSKTQNYRMAKMSKKNINVLYPKLLIVVDFTLFEKLKKRVKLVDQYLNIFWNAVDQLYIKLTEPQIKIKVVGVIIEKERNALRYFTNSTNYDQNHLNMTKAITECMRLKQSDYMNAEEISLPKHDGIITMTSLIDFITPKRHRLGIGSLNVLCSDIYTSCAIIHDDGKFGGIRTAIHEFGHMLGLEHDGFDEENKGEIYESCDPKYYKETNIHTVMDPNNDFSHKEYEWSTCSKKALQALRQSEHLQCLGNNSG